MEWIVGVGVLGLLVLVAAVAAHAPDDAGTEDPEDPQDRPYEWGDELHEFSYRHPWDDEDPWNG